MQRISSIKWPCQVPLLKYVMSPTGSYFFLNFLWLWVILSSVGMYTTWMPGTHGGPSKAMDSPGLRVESYHVRFSARATNTPNHLAISLAFRLLLCVLVHQIDSITWSSRVSRKRAWKGHWLWPSLPPGPLHVDSLCLAPVPSVRGGATAPALHATWAKSSLSPFGRVFGSLSHKTSIAGFPENLPRKMSRIGSGVLLWKPEKGI